MRWLLTMRRLLLAVGVIAAVVACASFRQSFREGSGEHVVGTRTYLYETQGGSFQSISVRIVESDWRLPVCMMDAAGIDCTFSSEYLLDGAAMREGGWQFLSQRSAERV